MSTAPVEAEEVAASDAPNPVVAAVAKSIAENAVLRDELSDHRPEWLSRAFAIIPGVTEWVDDTLCYAFGWACPAPPEFIETPFGSVYFWMLVAANIFVVILFVSVVGGLIARTCCDPTLSRLYRERDKLAAVSVTVLLPCYLPNEKDIMFDTIDHIIHHLEYDYPFTLLVCYNTPEHLQVEKKLASLDGTVYPNGRRLRIMKVNDSSSKAQNLNAALELVDTDNVVIYDADHHPDPQSLLIASAAMAAHDVSCIQGSTYLRSRPNLLAHYINAEFFVTHFVFFPAMQFVTSMGVFGGSNALWKTPDLRQYQFRHDVQTEDIEMSTRALLSGRVTIRFEPRCRSGELPPASFSALYRQRLRWALGWDQVTLQHMRHIWSARLHCGQKLGLTYILPLRWGILLSATLNALLTPAIAFWYFQTTGGPLGQPIDVCIIFSLFGFLVVCCVVAINMAMYEPLRRWPVVIFFQASGLLYIGWQILLVVVSLVKICAGTDGGWVVTKREGIVPPQLQSPLHAAFATVNNPEAAKLNARDSPLPTPFHAATEPGKTSGNSSGYQEIPAVNGDADSDANGDVNGHTNGHTRRPPLSNGHDIGNRCMASGHRSNGSSTNGFSRNNHNQNGHCSGGHASNFFRKISFERKTRSSKSSSGNRSLYMA